MTRTQRQLMRLLHGELEADEARALERRLERDPETAALYRRYAETWETLEAPSPSPLPAGFSTRVMAAARETTGELRWSSAPVWARASAAAALAAGVILGAAIGGSSAVASDDPEVYAFAEPLSLAETYWLALDDGDVQPVDGGGDSAR